MFDIVDVLIEVTKKYKELFEVYFLVLVLTIAFAFVPYSLRIKIALSYSTPWAIFTSFLVHENSMHLANNLRGFTLYTLLLVTLYEASIFFLKKQ